MSDTKKVNYLVDAWLVLTLAISFGAALAGVHIALKDGIAANKRNETYDQIPNLIPEAKKDRVEEGVFTVDIGGTPTERKFYRAYASDADKTTMGYMLPASGMGYVDKIDVLIGVDATVKNITGIYVLSQIETPGLGSKISLVDFRDKFKSKSTTKEIVARKTPQPPESNDIHAIASATISSQSVCSIVNRAVREFREHLDASIQRELTLSNIPIMFPGTTPEQIRDIPVGKKTVYQVLGADGETRAWIADGKRMGRWDRIDLLVALDPTAQTITKIHIIDQRERWWKKVVKAHYVESFAGMKSDPIVMVKKTSPADQQVLAVTKATVTSTAVCRIVNEAVELLKTTVADIESGKIVLKDGR
jgi:Na+-translocating ferredoxin:NAD+ oxidoreductase subunit G